MVDSEQVKNIDDLTELDFLSEVSTDLSEKVNLVKIIDTDVSSPQLNISSSNISNDDREENSLLDSTKLLTQPNLNSIAEEYQKQLIEHRLLTPTQNKLPGESTPEITPNLSANNPVQPNDIAVVTPSISNLTAFSNLTSLTTQVLSSFIIMMISP